MVACLFLMMSDEKYADMGECNFSGGTEKNCFQSKETSHAGISRKAQWVIAETNGGDFYSLGTPWQTLSDL